jgi:hypothetical protein
MTKEDDVKEQFAIDKNEKIIHNSMNLKMTFCNLLKTNNFLNKDWDLNTDAN